MLLSWEFNVPTCNNICVCCTEMGKTSTYLKIIFAPFNGVR